MEAASTRKPRGRPLSFDRDQALDKAVDVFWACGFEAASLDILTEKMGINRPSLYSAFGPKHQLFEAALDRYCATNGAPMARALALETDVRSLVSAYLGEIVLSVTREGKPRGCLISNVAAEMSGRDEKICQITSNLFTQTEAAIADLLQSAIDKGQLSPQFDPTAMSRMISVVPHGLAARARTGARRDDLLDMANDFVEVFFP